MNPTPSCPVGLYEFETTLRDVPLVCHLEYSPDEKGSTGSLGDPYEPDTDESMDLISVYVAGTDFDIESFMAATFLDQIERQALIAYKDNTP